MINNIALRLDLDALCNVAWLLSESYTLHKNNNNIQSIHGLILQRRDKSNHENGMNEFQWRLWQRNPSTINHINLPFRKQKFHSYHA